MSTDNMTPISSKTAGDLLALLGELRNVEPYRARVSALCTDLGNALAIAGEHRSHFEMMCAELLEAIGRATGRQLSTLATVASVQAATAALQETCPVLGKVIELPRAPERETAKAIEAETARALADMPPPIAVKMWVDKQPAEPFDTWAAPTVGEVVAFGETRAQVYLVRRLGPDMLEAFAVSLCNKKDVTW